MNKTIESVSTNYCTGCSACYNICPVNAIQMKENSEKFLFPYVNAETCINCGKCLSVCPVEKAIDDIHSKDMDSIFYAARGEHALVEKSSSGGMFSVIAEAIIEDGGIVCGCAWSDDYSEAYHILVDKKEDLDFIRRSKYLQSNMTDVFFQIKTKLEEKKWVLFSGTPCQVAGLYCYLEKKYSTLLTVDIICHGVPSKKAYQSWLKQYSKGRDVEFVNFRDKSVAHWGTVEFIKFKDGSSYYDNCFHGLWYKAFLNGISTRKCCGTCKYAHMDRIGDFTLGDFWGVSQILPGFDDGFGTSLLFVNTKKAKKFLKTIKHRVKLEEVSRKQVIDVAKVKNGNLLHPTPSHWARKRFFELLDHKNFSDAVEWTIHAKYDIGIVGWWYNLNYGGTLTYYALHQVLKKHGYSILMINRATDDPNYKPDTESIPYKFARKHYFISKSYLRHDIYTLNNHCNVFISGSDQLFNPLLWTWSGPEYFLNFVNGNNRKIGYASSFGNSYSDNKGLTDTMKYWLHRFDALSVREDYAVDIAKDVFDLKATKVLDPVFLCDVQDYLDVSKQSHATEKDFYVNFFLDPSEEKRQIIKYSQQIIGKQYINLINADHVEENIKKINMDNVKAYAEIEDWLYYYSNSDFIITDSFHGTCFAIIFHKPFISIANKLRGENRFISLLKELNLMDRLVYSLEDIKNRSHQLFTDIDYTETDRILEQKRKESKDWLINAIEGRRKNSEFQMLDKKIFELERMVQTLINNK